MRPALLYGNKQSVGSFSVILKCMTLTLSGYFALNSVFAPVWLAPIVRLSKNNCVKTNKDSTQYQQRECLAGTLVSGKRRFVRIFARVL